jgi:hypothetical protein
MTLISRDGFPLIILKVLASNNEVSSERRAAFYLEVFSLMACSTDTSSVGT